MIDINSAFFNKKLRKEITPDGIGNYQLSHSDIKELFDGPIHDMSYEQLKLLKKNYAPDRKKVNYSTNIKESNNNKMTKIIIKESEIKTLVENVVRGMLREYGEDSGGQDMTWGMYGRDSQRVNTGNNDFIMKGKEDYYAGVPIDACPYERGFNKYYKVDLSQLWKLGWENARNKDNM